MRAMARRADERRQALVELKAVDAAYPHGGTLRLEDGGDGRGSAAGCRRTAHSARSSRPSCSTGSASRRATRSGSARRRWKSAASSAPSPTGCRAASASARGSSFRSTRCARPGWCGPGSLITWIYRISPAGRRERDRATSGGCAPRRASAFPEAGWSVRSRDNAAPSLSRNIERFSQFLTLVGLTALVVGGVGVANAVSSFVDLKRPAIATLKCLGARNGMVFRIYLIQILILAALGIAIGLVDRRAAALRRQGGARRSRAGLGDRHLSGASSALAVLYGLLVTLSFALGPLGRARQMPASSLFADRAVHSPVAPPLRYRAAQAVALLALAALAIASRRRPRALALLCRRGDRRLRRAAARRRRSSCWRRAAPARSAARPCGSPSATSIGPAR